MAESLEFSAGLEFNSKDKKITAYRAATDSSSQSMKDVFKQTDVTLNTYFEEAVRVGQIYSVSIGP